MADADADRDGLLEAARKRSTIVRNSTSTSISTTTSMPTERAEFVEKLEMRNEVLEQAALMAAESPRIAESIRSLKCPVPSGETLGTCLAPFNSKTHPWKLAMTTPHAETPACYKWRISGKPLAPEAGGTKEPTSWRTEMLGDDACDREDKPDGDLVTPGEAVGRETREQKFEKLSKQYGWERYERADISEMLDFVESTLRRELALFKAKDQCLPPGFDIGDDLSAEFAIKIVELEETAETLGRERDQAIDEARKYFEARLVELNDGTQSLLQAKDDEMGEQTETVLKLESQVRELTAQRDKWQLRARKNFEVANENEDRMKDTIAELRATALELTAQVKAHRESDQDRDRLVRELDHALFGPTTARQARLCDLAKTVPRLVAELRATIERLMEAMQEHDDNQECGKHFERELADRRKVTSVTPPETPVKSPEK